MCDLSNSAIFNDLERPLPEFQGHAIPWHWVSQKRYDIQTQCHLNTNRDLHATGSFGMTLSNWAKYSVTRSVARSLCDSWASRFRCSVEFWITIVTFYYLSTQCVDNARIRNVKRGQMLEAKAEAEAKHLRPRPRPEPWGRGRGRDHNLEVKVEAEAKFNRPSPRPKSKRPNRTLYFAMKTYDIKTLCNH